MKRIAKIVLIFIMIIILVFKFTSIFNIPFLGCRMFQVISGSMEPTIQVGDFIVVKKEKNYRINDIVTYRVGEEYITHRIIGINGDVVVTKGDSNNVADNEFTMDMIIGKYLFRFSSFHHIFSVIFQPIVLILLFVIGLVITIFIPTKK